MTRHHNGQYRDDEQEQREAPYVTVKHEKDGAFFNVTASVMYYHVTPEGRQQPRTLTTSVNQSYTYEGALSHALAELSAMVRPGR